MVPQKKRSEHVADIQYPLGSRPPTRIEVRGDRYVTITAKIRIVEVWVVVGNKRGSMSVQRSQRPGHREHTHYWAISERCAHDTR